jgi:hypothetical protein
VISVVIARVGTEGEMAGREGSTGWRSGPKARVEECRVIDLAEWRRAGRLRPGATITTTWPWGSEVTFVLTVTVADDRVMLSHPIVGDDGSALLICYSVALTWTPCRYGGQRAWFVCPGVGRDEPCRRRVRKLYRLQRYFVCRHCLDLTYESRVEQPYSRALRTAQAVRMRLGGSADMTLPFPPKPKGMHWRTYWCIRAAYVAADQRASTLLDKRLARLDRLLERASRGL